MNFLTGLRAALYISLLSLPCAAQQQSSAPRIGCKDPYILTQATGLREGLIDQGFEVLNDAMLNMDTREEFPVVLRMKQGDFYQIVFVGNNRSSKVTLDLFDQRHKLVLHKEQRPMKQTSNVISFSFTPESSQDFMFMLSQVYKPGNTCGSFTIMRLKPEGER